MTRSSRRAARLSGRVVAATHNPGKLREIRELLAPHGVEAVGAAELNLAEPEETGLTFRDNAALKAEAAARASGLPALADDSGLCVEALDGAPGIYSARWAGGSKDFAAAMARVERELEAIGAPRPWRAYFVSALALALAGRADRDLRGPGRRRSRLPAARDGRVRLRPDLQAGRPRPHLRRDERRGEARDSRPTARSRSRTARGRSRSFARACL